MEPDLQKHSLLPRRRQIKVSVKPFHRVVGKMPDPPKVALRSKVLTGLVGCRGKALQCLTSGFLKGFGETFPKKRKFSQRSYSNFFNSNILSRSSAARSNCSSMAACFISLSSFLMSLFSSSTLIDSGSFSRPNFCFSVAAFVI